MSEPGSQRVETAGAAESIRAVVDNLARVVIAAGGRAFIEDVKVTGSKRGNVKAKAVTIFENFLARSIERGPQTLGVVALDLADHFFIKDRRLNRTLLDAQRLVKFFLPAAQAIDFLVRQHQRFDHDLFRHFLRSGLDHVDGFFRAGHD